jgi:hypothetical protein
MDPKVKAFKDAFAKFKEAMVYINKHAETLAKDPARLEKINANFQAKFELPLNEAWDALEASDKDRFSVLYFFRRGAADAQIREIMGYVDSVKGTVTSMALKTPEEILEYEKREAALEGRKHGSDSGG